MKALPLMVQRLRQRLIFLEMFYSRSLSRTSKSYGRMNGAACHRCSLPYLKPFVWSLLCELGILHHSFVNLSMKACSVKTPDQLPWRGHIRLLGHMQQLIHYCQCFV